MKTLILSIIILYTKIAFGSVLEHRLFLYQLPDSWAVKKGFMGSDFVTHPPLVSGREPLLVYVKSFKHKINKKDAFNFLTNDIKNKKNWSEIQIIEKRKINNTAFVVEAVYKKQGVYQKGIFSVVPLKKEYVFIMISSEPNNIEAYINEIKYFINSVKTKG